MKNAYLNINDVKKYDTFEAYCENAYCCNKNPWSDLDENCRECKEEYYRIRQEISGEH